MRRVHWLLASLTGLALTASSATAEDSWIKLRPIQLKSTATETAPRGSIELASLETPQFQGDVSADAEIVNDEVGSKEFFPQPAVQDAEPNWVATNSVEFAEDESCCPQWYGRVEAIFLKRDGQIGNQPVVLQDLTGAVLFSTGNLNFSNEVGPSILLGMGCDDCTAVELSYFGVYSMSARGAVFGLNNLDIPPDLVVPASDFDNARAMRITYNSRLNNFELNGAHFLTGSRPCGGIELLAGFRYLNVEEVFNINSTDDDNSVSDYRIRARNNLFGGQLGLRCTHRWNRLGFDATGKAGIFVNAADQTQFVGDIGNTVVLRDFLTGAPVTSHRSLTSFVGDLNASLSYCLTDHISIRGGYNLIWIEGLALAPNQLDFSFNALSGTGVNAGGGGMFLHGANAGLEFRW